MTNITMAFRATSVVLCLFAFMALPGCGSTQKRADRDFHTSGSREADQRADQRMAKAEQLSPDAQGARGDSKNGTKAEEKKPLYDRLGGEQGVKAIVDDFVTRAMADPRVNWERKGVTRGGLSLSRGKSVEWNPSPENVEQLKKHVAQFISLSTGGPAFYDGQEMKQAHAGRRISNAEFDAAVGDLKATLDKLQVPNQEQRELLAIIESTRPQVVEER